MVQSPRDRLTRISMSLAILAAFSTLTFPVVLPYILGSVAMILAILSKGGSEKFSKRGKKAAMIAAIVITVNTVLLVSSISYFNRVLREPELQEQFSELLYKTYGMTFEEFMQQFNAFYPFKP